MTGLPPVTGPLWPSVPSGRAVFGGACTHQAPDSCRWCDGTSQDEAELRRDRRRAETNRRGMT